MTAKDGTAGEPERYMTTQFADTAPKFSPRVLTANGVSGIDMTADGKRLIAVMPTVIGPAPRAEHTIIFVQNSFDELRRRVPVSRRAATTSS
jgi:hypothetical protein